MQEVNRVIDWFSGHARDLPWRDTSPWGVLVSEFMLQQTPVVRVVPVWQAWLDRWPTPTDLAGEPQSEALKAWGRLGYPRRAARLHATARDLRDRYSGEVPTTYDDLLSLPGVGDYTASAVLAFAFDQRAVVLDVNVRRVLSRGWLGLAHPGNGVSAVERALAARLAPENDADSARWAAASMELGAVVCTANNPECSACPLEKTCAWNANGRPDNAARPRGQATFAGSDRQVRGLILATLRNAARSSTRAELFGSSTDEVQFERALVSLIADGLIEAMRSGRYRLAR